MRPYRYENPISFDLSPLPAILAFLRGFVEHALFRGRKRCWERWFEKSEDSQLGPAGGMTSDLSKHFLSWSHVNNYYK